jgi:hypothetical protein
MLSFLYRPHNLTPPLSGTLNINSPSTRIFTSTFLHPRPRSFSCSMSKSKEMSNGTNYTKVLNIKNINPAVVAAKYAVRGELALRANALTEQVKQGGVDLPFDDVVHCEIGNPQALNQKPLSFIRQVYSSSHVFLI